MDFKVGDLVRIQGADKCFGFQIPPVKIDGKIGKIMDVRPATAVIVDIDHKGYYLENCWLEKISVEPVKDGFDKVNKIREWLEENNAKTGETKENKNMRNDTLERWYEKSCNALTKTLDREKEILTNEDEAVLHTTHIIKELNEYLEGFNAECVPIYFDKHCSTTKETDDKIDNFTEKTNKLKTELAEKKADVYALLSMCSDKDYSEYEPFEILKVQGIIDKELDIIVKNYDLGVE